MPELCHDVLVFCAGLMGGRPALVPAGGLSVVLFRASRIVGGAGTIPD